MVFVSYLHPLTNPWKLRVVENISVLLVSGFKLEEVILITHSFVGFPSKSIYPSLFLRAAPNGVPNHQVAL